MTPLPDLTYWSQLLARLFLELLVLSSVAGLAGQLMRSAASRRRTWMAAFFGFAFILGMELTGLNGFFQLRQPVGASPHSHPARSDPPGWRVKVADSEPAAAMNLGAARPRPGGIQERMASAAAPLWWPAGVWVGGFAFWFLRVLFGRYACLRTQAQLPEDVEKSLPAEFDAWRRRMHIRKPVQFKCLDKLPGPIAFGLLRPAIGLPANFLAAFTESQRKVVLLHELAHLQVHDPFWHWAADMLAAMLWWNPVVWWARREFSLASELAADEASHWVEDGGPILAQCLVETGQRYRGMPTGIRWGISSLGFQSALGRRVVHLLSRDPGQFIPATRHGWLGLALGSLPTGILITAAIGSWTPLKPLPGNQGGFLAAFWRNSLPGLRLETSGESPPKNHHLSPTIPSADKTNPPPLAAERWAAKPPPLETKTFRLDTETFPNYARVIGYLEQATGIHLSASNWKDPIRSDPWINYWGDQNDDEDRRSLFYSDRSGALLIRATAEELDKVEAAIQTLKKSELQIRIESRFVEIQREAVATLPLPHRTSGQAAILSQGEFHKIDQILSQTKGVNIRLAPMLTTTSGRQGQVSANNLRSILAPLTNSTTGEIVAGIQTIPTGPSLDVLGHVLTNRLIRLDLRPSYEEFQGYEATRNPAKPDAEIPMPRILHWSETNSTLLTSGQTAFCGRLDWDKAVQAPAQSDRWLTNKVTLLVFVTVNLDTLKKNP